MLAEFTTWLLSLIGKIFTAVWSFVVDAFINALDLIGGAVVGLLAAIPVPGFMSQGLAPLYGALPPGALYVLDQVGVPQGLALLGVALAFRLARKALTLFQW